MINLTKHLSIIPIIILICSFNLNLQAQPWSDDPPRIEKPTTHVRAKNHSHLGIMVGRSIGATVLSENVKYEPVLLMLYASFPLKKHTTKPSRWFVVTEPQFNVFIQDRKVTHFETGINLGLQHRWYMNPTSWFYAQISSGPHYISLNSERQAGGFIFSDNFAAGLSFKFINQLRTEIQYRFRHLSNASIKRPNAGLNNHFLMFGLVFEL
ncbi:MAG: acyloxyacyl hydrolase [Cyclobacteriaceae bacterium]|nr:acyloxyacyl hydrolase [Cyclobacteriaceae bacterium]